MRSDDLDVLATTLGASSSGVLTAAGLRLAGADPDAVKDALRERWQAPVQGIYVPHQAELSLAELGHVAVAHAGPGAVVTGLLGAQILGLRWIPDLPGAMVLIAPEVRRRGSQGLVLVRRCAGLSGLVTNEWQGLPVAPVAQVVVDACRQVLAVRRARREGPPSLLRRQWFEESCLRDIRGLVLGAVADDRCSLEQLRDVLEAGAMHDSALIRRACRDAERGAASPPEAELLDGLMDYGVTFASNVEVWDGETLVAVLDAYLFGTGVGAELDSEEAHGEASALDATLQRHKRLKAYDIELCHVTPTRYRAAPEAFHAELFAEARASLARGKGDPAGLRLVPRGPLLCGPRRADPPYRLPTRSDSPTLPDAA